IQSFGIICGGARNRSRHGRGGGLAEHAGFDLIAQRNDALPLELEIERDLVAAKRIDAHDGDIRLGKAHRPFRRRGKPQDRLGIELVEAYGLASVSRDKASGVSMAIRMPGSPSSISTISSGWAAKSGFAPRSPLSVFSSGKRGAPQSTGLPCLPS